MIGMRPSGPPWLPLWGESPLLGEALFDPPVDPAALGGLLGTALSPPSPEASARCAALTGEAGGVRSSAAPLNAPAASLSGDVGSDGKDAFRSASSIAISALRHEETGRRGRSACLRMTCSNLHSAAGHCVFACAQAPAPAAWSCMQQALAGPGGVGGRRQTRLARMSSSNCSGSPGVFCALPCAASSACEPVRARCEEKASEAGSAGQSVAIEQSTEVRGQAPQVSVCPTHRWAGGRKRRTLVGGGLDCCVELFCELFRGGIGARVRKTWVYPPRQRGRQKWPSRHRQTKRGAPD